MPLLRWWRCLAVDPPLGGDPLNVSTKNYTRHGGSVKGLAVFPRVFKPLLGVNRARRDRSHDNGP
jgi:hypothetical protein